MKHFLRWMYVFVGVWGAYAIYDFTSFLGVPALAVLCVEMLYAFCAGVGFSLMGDGGVE